MVRMLTVQRESAGVLHHGRRISRYVSWVYFNRTCRKSSMDALMHNRYGWSSGIAGICAHAYGQKSRDKVTRSTRPIS